MPRELRNVLLVQLPIPPPGHQPIRGNVPLAAGYLKLMARQCGLEADCRIDIFPASEANRLGDQGLVEAILARQPWLVGFTCYLWNIDRTLWVAERLKERQPDLLVLVGGPEVTADNAWVLDHPAIDYAAIGEGEQTFCELLAALLTAGEPQAPVDGLYVRPRAARQPLTLSPLHPLTPSAPQPPFRQPLPRLDDISSPYLAGILDAAEEELLLLETIRGCVFKCKFCYYPKSYDKLYFLSRDKLVANLRHAEERGAREVVLLDPTLNQRKDFGDFLKLLGEHNPGQRFTYFGELRAEGITPEIARLMREANFTEVEVGLQSIDSLAMDLMDRRNHLRAFERGAQALLDVGIKVKVDLIIGLPGDTVQSVRRGIEYVRASGLYTSVQVFNLAVLPGTAFRQEARELGLVYSARTPYYVVRTPTLETADLYGLMQEAQEAFEVEFDPLPPPVLDFSADDSSAACWRVDLDRMDWESLPPPATERGLAFTLWLESSDFHRDRQRAAELAQQLLADNPHTTLQIVLAPAGDPRRLTAETLEFLRRTCYQETSYLDRFYSILPGPPKGAKRLVVLISAEERKGLAPDWAAMVEEYATLVWPAQESRSAEWEIAEQVVAGAD